MDRSWMRNSKPGDREYDAGVRQFINFAVKNSRGRERLPCLCHKCHNLLHKRVDEILNHLTKFAFDNTYTCWIWHGEKMDETHVGKPKNSLFEEENVVEEFEKQGISVTLVPRYLTWLKAHSRAEDGNLIFDNPIDLAVADAIKTLEAQCKGGKVVIEGRRDDILARALKKPEQGRHVFGVGSGVTMRDEDQVTQFFTSVGNGKLGENGGQLGGGDGQMGGNGGQRLNGVKSTCSTGVGYEGVLFTQLLTGGAFKSGGQLGEGDIDSQVPSKPPLSQQQIEPYRVPWPENKDVNQEEPAFPDIELHSSVPKSMPIITNHSPNPDNNFRRGWNDCCLALEVNKELEIVALGRVYIPEELEVIVLDGKPVPHDTRQVDVIHDIVPTALLPCPMGELTFVCQAKDSYIAWPSHLILPKMKQSVKQVDTPTSRSPPSQASSTRKYVVTDTDRVKLSSGLVITFKGVENNVREFARRVINEYCPRQPEGTVDCGNYICRYMQEIIEKRRQVIPEKYFDGGLNTYSQEMVDKIRDSWITYVFKHNVIGDEEDDMEVVE
ncbi:Bardet-Biedl syndrome 10 protein [Bienertia sinuspersici]